MSGHRVDPHPYCNVSLLIEWPDGHSLDSCDVRLPGYAGDALWNAFLSLSFIDELVSEAGLHRGDSSERPGERIEGEPTEAKSPNWRALRQDCVDRIDSLVGSSRETRRAFAWLEKNLPKTKSRGWNMYRIQKDCPYLHSRTGARTAVLWLIQRDRICRERRNGYGNSFFYWAPGGRS